MNRLTEIGVKYNTDKATGHGYTEFYDSYLVKYINPNIFEIRIYDGASLKMWEEYYGSPLIVAMDIDDKRQYENQNTKIFVGDQGNKNDLLKCLEFCKEYQVIIDDGSHVIGHQISTFVTMFPYLASGGTYILEDLHTSFIGGQYNPQNDRTTAYDFLYRITRGLEIQTPYATEEEICYLNKNILGAQIFQLNENDYFHSITSVIIKK